MPVSNFGHHLLTHHANSPKLNLVNEEKIWQWNPIPTPLNPQTKIKITVSCLPVVAVETTMLETAVLPNHNTTRIRNNNTIDKVTAGCQSHEAQWIQIFRQHHLQLEVQEDSTNALVLSKSKFTDSTFKIPFQSKWRKDPSAMIGIFPRTLIPRYPVPH